MAAQTPDKEKALGLALAQIDKQFGKGSVMRLGDRPESPMAVIPTGSIALDIALGVGGLPRGRVVEIFGPESSGKTTVALHAVANAQSLGGIAAFIDAEHALDPDYAQALGVDTRERTGTRIPALARRIGQPPRARPGRIDDRHAAQPRDDRLLAVEQPGGAGVAVRVGEPCGLQVEPAPRRGALERPRRREPPGHVERERPLDLADRVVQVDERPDVRA